MNREYSHKKHELEKQDECCSRSCFTKVSNVRAAKIISNSFFMMWVCKLMSKKDLKTFAVLSNIEVDSKESILMLIRFIDLCAKCNATISEKNQFMS